MGQTHTYFAIATNEGKESDPIGVAEMRSPIFISREHPKECFSFWYSFGDRVNEEILAIFLEDMSQARVKDLWMLREIGRAHV